MNHPNLLNDELTAPGNTLGTKPMHTCLKKKTDIGYHSADTMACPSSQQNLKTSSPGRLLLLS